jgi:6-phosphogluconate dehydrogenase
MEIAMVGLGKMGANMATRLLHGGHQVVVYDINEIAVQALKHRAQRALARWQKLPQK